MSFLNYLKCIKTYKYLVRSSRKILTKQKYITSFNILRRTGGQTVLFKRAPKHFKLGKQKLCFFHSNLVREETLLTSGSLLLVNPRIIYALCENDATIQNEPTIFLFRILIKTTAWFSLH
jgi:hypothetical protein